jgi:pimeloyl-ACP methyl ester carboxylesterase
MDLQIKTLKGSFDKPACVFAPGLGMESAIWAAPSEARMLGGLVSLGRIYRDPNLRTLYHDLAERGYTVFTWSPRRPVGPIEETVNELYSVIEFIREIKSAGIILIGHSRGGLVSRIALPRILESGASLKALITIASPHHGSSMARWASLLAPLAEFVDRYIPKKEHRAFTNAVKRVLGFLASKGVRELLPDSELINSLYDKKPFGLYCLSVGGTNPALVEVNNYLRIPGTLQKVVPKGILPPEMVDGKGDCLVTDESAVLSYADEHLTFYKNHIKILTDPEPREEILRRIEGMVEVKISDEVMR